MSEKAAVTGGAAPPFGLWERTLAMRYLRAKRSQGGVALISVISFVGIMLAVATLIIVMSVMNGFRSELLGRILGFQGHIYVTGGVLDGPARDRATAGAIEQLQFDRLGPYDACGFAALNGALCAGRQRGWSIERLDLRNSGDTSGERSRVVGYGAWAFIAS